MFWLQRKKETTAKNRHCKEMFWKDVARKTVFSQLQLAVFEAGLAQQRHIQNFTCRNWRKSRTKVSFAKLTCSNWQILKEVSQESLVSISLQLDHRDKNAPHQRPEPCQPIVAQIPAFSYYLMPNSISFSIAYSYYLILITSVFTIKVVLLSPCV